MSRHGVFSWIGASSGSSGARVWGIFVEYNISIEDVAGEF